MLMAVGMRGNGSKIFRKVMVRKRGKTAVATKDITSKGRNMERDTTSGQMVRFMKETGTRIKSKGTERINGPMGGSFPESG